MCKECQCHPTRVRRTTQPSTVAVQHVGNFRLHDDPALGLHEESSGHWPRKEGGRRKAKGGSWGERSVSNLHSPALQFKLECCAAAATRDLAVMDQGNTLVGAGDEPAEWGEPSATISPNHDRLHQFD
jgi:hypothetical protein